jgi:hypothetical protein
MNKYPIVFKAEAHAPIRHGENVMERHNRRSEGPKVPKGIRTVLRDHRKLLRINSYNNTRIKSSGRL